MKRSFGMFQPLPAFCPLTALLCLAPLPGQAEDYTYVTNNGAITITKYLGAGGDVIIPAEINSLPVVAISTDAFWPQTTNFIAITIPQTVTNFVGPDPFPFCNYLVSISVHALNPVFSSADGVMFNKTKTTLIQYPAARTAPGYIIPADVTAVGRQAFALCSTLTSVTISDSVTNIGPSAFLGCHFLTNVVFGSGLTTISDHAFEQCERLTHLSLPDSLIVIGPGAFMSCLRLGQFTIPQSVTTLAAYAFGSCGIGSIAIPDSVTNIGSGLFAYAYVTNVSIGNNVTEIPGDMFSHCSELVSVTVGSRVASIGDYAFGNCQYPWLFFRGNAPSYVSPTAFYDVIGDIPSFYLPNTTGWPVWGLTCVLWNPEIQTTAPGFGVRTNGFGLPITGTPDIPFVLEASPAIAGGTWTPLGTFTMDNGAVFYCDQDWTNYPARFYRIRSL